MSRSLTQRVVHTCRTALRQFPEGAQVDLVSLVRATGVPARLPLVTRRLRDGHWIAPDGHGGWLRGGPQHPGPAPHSRGA